MASSSLKQVAIRGTIWTLLGFGTQYVLRLAGNIFLTRLLPPSAFGLMQLSTSILIGLIMLSDTGVGPNIIQSKRGEDPVFLNTARTIQIVRGVAIFLICTAIALPVARFYGQPEVAGLVILAGINMLIMGFQSMSFYLLNRNLFIRKQEMFSLVEQVVPLIVMLIWATISPTVWALAAGYILAPLLRLFWTHYLVPGPASKLMWEKESVREIFSFGKWIFFSTSATFFAVQADRLILGKLVGFELLGIYGVALTFAEMPRRIVGKISGQILLPVISKIADKPRQELRAILLSNRQKVLLLSIAFLVPLVCFGDLAIKLLYTGKYTAAAWMLPILALGIWPNLLHESLRQSLVAIGQPKYEAYGQFFKSIFVCAGIPIGIHFFGMLGAIVVVACNDLPLYACTCFGLLQEKLSSIKQDFLMSSLLLLLIGGVILLRYAIGLGSPISTLFSS
ncbi:MAG TPA: oligosaccharide flippase family protein [Leptolyngbyaceae cyanobacterium M33_DOE_097]|uniref:Polysaccharide biosynthesis protein n=1 Tax=Oscillatoriales cyanobacterium SpSt-418 TaxID=2282169 RepID=A0A7C3PFM1_9CYAN|nr:oligosaccharide flippase family protein [Leptolyngbyaceae cyanobacterium M33_DOE_097]